MYMFCLSKGVMYRESVLQSLDHGAGLPRWWNVAPSFSFWYVASSETADGNACSRSLMVVTSAEYQQAHRKVLWAMAESLLEIVLGWSLGAYTYVSTTIGIHR